VRYLNFDFYKKHNVKLNENWIRDRRLMIIKKVDHFEDRLEVASSVIKNKLNSELFRLHSKRLRQFDRLMQKYTKLRNNVYELNAKEMYEVKKLKKFFLMKANVPKFSYDDDAIGLLAEPPKNAELERKNSKTSKSDLNMSHHSQVTVSKGRSKVL
jgi:hypothetical protein